MAKRTKRKPGPQARTGKPAIIRITIRVDPKEARQLKLAASQKGATLSELIRSRALQGAA